MTGQSALTLSYPDICQLLIEASHISSAFARIENHYFINEGWMRQGQLLEKESIDKMCVRFYPGYHFSCSRLRLFDGLRLVDIFRVWSFRGDMM